MKINENYFLLTFPAVKFPLYKEMPHKRIVRLSTVKIFTLAFGFIICSIIWYVEKTYVRFLVKIYRHIDLKLYEHKIVYLSDKLNLA